MTTPFLGAQIPLVSTRAVGFIPQGEGMIIDDGIMTAGHLGKSVWYGVSAGAVSKETFPAVDLKMVSLFVRIVT
jgi:hypothetical protein